MKKLLVLALLCAFCACTNPDGARRILTQQGYTDITLTGYDAWSCGQDDWYSTGFVATNVNGVRVTGVVCQGMFKGATIRFK